MHRRGAAWAAIRAICGKAWERGLLSGFNGNVSLRLEGHLYVTQTGAAKGYLREDEVAVLELPATPGASARVVCGRPSSECGMHVALYRANPELAGIVHTHPRHLLALELVTPPEAFLRLPLFEAERLRADLGLVPALPPGGLELAEAVAAAHAGKRAVWMAGHGLCAAAAGEPEAALVAALAVSEELDHLACVQLLALGQGGRLPRGTGPGGVI